MSSSPKSRRYKETTFQQLRSFYETARLGSLSAAADQLDLSHPTVWAQVHALERDLGDLLIEPYGRGCRLTSAGETLAELAAPIVLGAASLRQRYHETRQGKRTSLIVTATPRVLTDDLPKCIREYTNRRPDVDLTLRELTQLEVVEQVANGEADIGVAGLTSETSSQKSKWIEQLTVYEVVFALITPKDHPLARRKTIQLEDLADYPLLNGPSAFTELDVLARLESLGVFRNHPCRVEAQFTATSRTYVKLGYGVALISKRKHEPPHPDFHERDMSVYFGSAPICLIRRKGQPAQSASDDFQAIVRETLGPKQDAKSLTIKKNRKKKSS